MDNQNTESRSTLDRVASVLFRKVAAPITIAAGLAGCFNAAGHRPLNEDDVKLRDEVRQEQYQMDVGALAKQNLSEANMTDDELASKGEIKSYVTPAGYSDLAKGFAANSVEGQALVELNNANQYISNLFSGAKIRRHALRSLKSNVDFEGFERYGKMSREDIEAVADNLKNLSTSLSRITVEQRAALAKLGNKDSAAMLDYNEKALRTLNALFTSIADTETHEGHLDKVCDAQRYSASILKSLTGHDQYGTIEGEGRQVLNTLLNEKVRDVVPARTSFAKDYGWEEGATLKDAYNDLLKKTYDEAVAWSDNSLEKICNIHLGKALEMSKEARKNVPGYTTKQMIAVNRVIAKDFLAKMGTAAQDGNGDSISVLKDIILPAAPGYSLIAMLLNLKAFDNDSYSPEGASPEAKYERTLVDGNSINNGLQTRYNVPGSLSGYRVRFSSAAISTGLQIGGAVLYFVNKGKGNNGSNGSGPATSSSGDDVITPGTGPRKN